MGFTKEEEEIQNYREIIELNRKLLDELDKEELNKEEVYNILDKIKYFVKFL